MIETALLPFQFPFMTNAFLIALVVAPPTALLSCFLVLKGWALMGDAVSHAILPGVVLAYLFGLPLIVGAFAAGMSCALLTGYLSENSRVKRDTAMGVVFSGMFAVGLILFVAFPSDAHLDHILFGNMLGIGRADLWTALALSAPIVGVLLLKWRDFLLHAFDPAQAQASGLRTGLLHYGLLTILSLTVVSVLSAVGLILAVALSGHARGDRLPADAQFRSNARSLGPRLHAGDGGGRLCQLLARQRAGPDRRARADSDLPVGVRPAPDRDRTRVASRVTRQRTDRRPGPFGPRRRSNGHSPHRTTTGKRPEPLSIESAPV